MIPTLNETVVHYSNFDDSAPIEWQNALDDGPFGNNYQTCIIEENPEYSKTTTTKSLFIYKLISEKNKVESHFKKKVGSLKLSEKWQKEGVLPPNFQCKKIAKNLLVLLFDRFELMPEKIAPTIEGGIFIKYQNVENDHELIIEVYNDSDIAALISFDKKILGAFDVIDVEHEFTSIMKLFNELPIS